MGGRVQRQVPGRCDIDIQLPGRSTVFWESDQGLKIRSGNKTWNFSKIGY
jgi:hypothetical protein